MGNSAISLLSGSTITLIYGVALVLFFIVLVVMTIALIKNKSEEDGDDSYDEDENLIDDEEYEEEDDSEETTQLLDNSEVEEDDSDEPTQVLEEPEDESDEKTQVLVKNMTDSAFAVELSKKDNLADSAFSEETASKAVDSAFAVEPESSATESKAVAENEELSAVEKDSAEVPTDNNEEVAITEEDTESQSDIFEEAEDSAFSEPEPEINSAFAVDDTNSNNDIPEDSAFSDNQAFPTGSVFEQAGVALDNPPPNRRMYVEEEIPADSAFAPEMPIDSSWMATEQVDMNSGYGMQSLLDEAIDASVKEAAALGEAVATPKPVVKEKLPKKKPAKNASKSPKAFDKSNEEFYWFNKKDVAERPSYKSPEMYYHYFNLAEDCIEELLMEMYDCALVRTEEIRYIAYGIAPRAVSMKEILASGSSNYTSQKKVKNPSTQDMIKIYEKWCGYVNKLFEKIEINADSYTIQKIQELLYDFGKNDVDVLLEGK